MVSSGRHHAGYSGSLSDRGGELAEFRKIFKKALTSYPTRCISSPHSAGVTQLVECNLAKVDVASSSLVTRSISIRFF